MTSGMGPRVSAELFTVPFVLTGEPSLQRDAPGRRRDRADRPAVIPLRRRRGKHHRLLRAVFPGEQHTGTDTDREARRKQDGGAEGWHVGRTQRIVNSSGKSQLRSEDRTRQALVSEFATRIRPCLISHSVFCHRSGSDVSHEVIVEHDIAVPSLLTARACGVEPWCWSRQTFSPEEERDGSAEGMG